MASGYIGKISAIVTANTSDLSRKLSQSSKEANAFANSLKTSIDRAGTNAQKSLEKIFTPLQQLERKLKAASSRSLDLKIPLDQVRAFVSAAEAINKPLERSAGGFAKLSTEVQAAFIPALQSAQTAAVNLNQQIATTGTASASSFQIAASEARKAEQAIQRLAQAQEIAAKGLTGRELQFSNPAAFASLNRTANLTKQAGKLPAGALEGSDIANRVAKLNGLSQSILVGLSRLESLRIDPTVNTTQIEQAEKKLNSLLAAARRTQNGLESAIEDQANFTEGNPTGTFGPPRPFTSFDPSGRTLQERFEQINAINNARALEEQTAEEVAAADAAAAAAAEKRAEAARRFKASQGLTVLTDSEAQISRTRQNLRDLQQEANRLSQAFDAVSNQQFFDTSALLRQQGELSGIREIIGRVSSDVRGPLASAFQRYAVVVTNALQQGEDGFEENTQEIERQRAELIKLIATTGQVGNVGQITGQVKRAGDIGRGGFDKFSLAINQAAFAIDDFFSVTGGLEFKLRAVQNNITQLGFVAGGTKGLIAALAAVIGGQLAIAVLKATGVMEENKDVMEALNSAFGEQKQRVDALAAAYNNLGSSIKDSGLNEAGRTQASRRRELEEIKRLEEEARNARASAVDPEAEALRIEIARLRRLSQESDSAGERTANEIIIGDLEQALERRSREAGARQSTDRTVSDTVIQAEIDRINTQFNQLINSLSGENTEIAEQALERERTRQLGEFRDGSGQLRASLRDDPLAQRRALDDEIARVKESLDGVRTARAFNPLSPSLSVAEDEYQDQLARLSAEYAALEVRIRDAAPGAALVRFVEASFAVADTLDRARENLDQVVGGRGPLGDAVSAVSRSLETRRSQADQARAEGDTERLDALTKQISALEEYALELESASAATRIFSDTLKRLADDLNQTVAQEARGRADSLRRQANADPDDPFLSRQRRRAEEEARRAERRARENQEETIALRQQFEDDAITGRLGPEVQALINEREKLQADIESGRLSVEEERAARRRLREIDAELNERFEDSPQGQAAAAAADEADSDAARFSQRQESERRGRDLMVTDGERAARETIQSLEDILNAGFARVRAGEDFGTVFDEVDAARARVRDDARRSIAPALFALQDQVANAVLQGPSRAALNAADVTTTQGTAELNRLLRGDDPARDQNLLELQKQTAELEKLNQNLGAVGVAP